MVVGVNMAIWKITCPDCNHCEEVRIDINDFSEKEQKEFLDRERQNTLLKLNVIQEGMKPLP